MTGTPYPQPEARHERLDAAWTKTLNDDERFKIVSRDEGGVRLREFATSPANLNEVWLDTRQFGQRDYLIYEGEHVTYADAHRVSASVRAWLRVHGVRSGDRVGIAMRNYPEWMLIYWACVSAGVTVVGLNAWWVAEELAAALAECLPKAVFCDEERLERLARWQGGAATTCAIVLVRAEPPSGVTAWSDVISESDVEEKTVAIDPDADACIFFTSGTTGRAKGARLTHRGCVSNIMNIRFGLQVGEQARRPDVAPSAALPPKVLLTTPLFHVTANNGGAQPAAVLGGALVLMYKWDARQALRLIESERITMVVGIPMMLREMLQHPEAEQRDITSLSSLSGGGAPIPPHFLENVSAKRGGPQMGTGYGMTELSGTAAIIMGDALLAKPRSCGRLLPTFEAKIIDEAGLTLGTHTPGELCLRGSGVIPGYLDQPLDYAGPAEDGWMRTGDVAEIDALGYLYLVDRKKDMILRGGENVYCTEVEAALLAHLDVAEACAFAVDDERLGEDVGAAVFLKPGTRADATALRRHVGQLLARYKVPRHIWFSQAPLPRNATGKILRRQLKESLAAHPPPDVSPSDGGHNGHV